MNKRTLFFLEIGLAILLISQYITEHKKMGYSAVSNMTLFILLYVVIMIIRGIKEKAWKE